MVLGCYEPGGLSVSGERQSAKGGDDYRFGITQGPNEPDNGQGRFIKSKESVVEVGNCRNWGLHRANSWQQNAENVRAVDGLLRSFNIMAGNTFRAATTTTYPKEAKPLNLIPPLIRFFFHWSILTQVGSQTDTHADPPNGEDRDGTRGF